MTKSVLLVVKHQDDQHIINTIVDFNAKVYVGSPKITFLKHTGNTAVCE